MTLLFDALKDKETDNRMVQRGLGKGLIFEDQVKKLLSNLPDDAENAEYINIDEKMTELAGKSGLR